jgi:hypothetical protein
MDKAAYFQSVYEAQFALGKKTGACLSAQYLALEAFLQRSPDWHYQWWPIVGITPKAWFILQTRAAVETQAAHDPYPRAYSRSSIRPRGARPETV